MKRFLIGLLPVFLIIAGITQAQVAVNTDGSAADPSAMLDIQSDTAGILIPRMTTAQRDAIKNPAKGLMVYVTDDNTFYYFNGTSWDKVGKSAQLWHISGNYVYDLTDSIGIGTNTPSAPLEVAGRISQSGTGRSVFIGTDAGKNDDLSNNNNVFVGYEAGKENATGNNNIAVGYQALLNNSSGVNNTALGSQTLQSNTTGTNNTAVGMVALYSNNSGKFNTATGAGGLALNTSGSCNTAEGVEALYTNTVGDSNTAIGYHALYANTTGKMNTAIGLKALHSNTTGLNNTASGYLALGHNNTGSGNTADGYAALINNTGGSQNTAVGFGAIAMNTGGGQNTALGFKSLYNDHAGSHNTAIGYNAGYSTTGSGNVFIGNYAGYNETGSNKLYIDNSNTSTPLIGGDFSTNEIDFNGVIKISTGTAKNTPKPGMIRWNESEQDFEGFTGVKWISLTKTDHWGIEPPATQTVSSTPSSTKDSSFLGRSVDIEGNYVFVGASGKSNITGTVYVYKYYESYQTFFLNTHLVASDSLAGDGFGYSVSVDGDYLFVGAPNYNNIGKVYIFHFENNQWIEKDSLTPPENKGTNFGNSVCISGNYAIVGDYEYNNHGSVYFYHFNGTQWELQNTFIADAYTYRFGVSVSIDGTFAVVGANLSHSYRGSLFFYHYNDTSWVQENVFIGNLNVYLLGTSVSISGENAVAGAPGWWTNTGLVYSYHYNGSSWELQDTITASDKNKNYGFGQSVFYNGDYLYVGAPLYKDNRGMVYVYTPTGTNWQEIARLHTSDDETNTYFGKSISASSKWVIVGAPYKDVNHTDDGKVYFFNLH